MRPLPILIAVPLLVATPAFAQVTVDLHALQALPDNPAPRHSSRASQAPTRAVQAPVASQDKQAAASPAPPASAASPVASISGAKQATPAAPQPALPENVPATASINPIVPPEPQPGAAPPPPPVSDKAATTAEATTVGLRLTFAPEQSDLSPASIGSIKQLTAKAPSSDETTFNVMAYAPGKKDDPSTARRVSLSRAMAVRSALVADGVPSARIFVRALGEQYGDGPPDRVDIDVTGPGSTVAR